MKFDTTKNKLIKIRNEEELQNHRIWVQSQFNKRVVSSVTTRKPSSSSFKTVIDISSDWEQMTGTLEVSGDEEFESDNTMYRNWNIYIGRFDIRLLPFINVHFIIRNSGGTWDDEAQIDTPSFSYVYDIKDRTGESNDNFKNVTLVAGFYFSDGDVSSMYDAKLVVEFENPNDYV